MTVTPLFLVIESWVVPNSTLLPLALAYAEVEPMANVYISITSANIEDKTFFINLSFLLVCFTFCFDIAIVSYFNRVLKTVFHILCFH